MASRREDNVIKCGAQAKASCSNNSLKCWPLKDTVVAVHDPQNESRTSFESLLTRATIAP